MSQRQTFRVVLESGEVRSVIVTTVSDELGEAYFAGLSDGYATPERAVTAWCTSTMLRVREIRAPGELTTAEQVEVMRTRCEAACDGLFNALDFYDGASGACDCRDAIKALKP